MEIVMSESSPSQAPALESEYHLQVYRRLPLVPARGSGARIWDSNGREYIDALAGIAVLNVGHCHPHVVSAIQRQAAQLTHISNFFVTEAQAQLARRLCELSGLDRVFFNNSGAEANEGAFKLARNWYHSKRGGSPRGGVIVSMEGCFHGRTLATIAAGKDIYQQGFEPIPSGYRRIPFNDVAALDRAVDGDTAAVIIEPIQGEGGVTAATPEFMQAARQICSDRGAALIFDEVQCGMGRTGTMFAYEQYGVRPDILSLAKGLGGGVPIGATIVSQEIADALPKGRHGTTFGGNPLACAAALATIEVIEDEDLLDRASELGDYLVEKLEAAREHEPSIKEIRGIGLMRGVVLDFEGAGVVRRMLDKGVISNCTALNVMRLIPPLVISKRDLDTVISVMLQAIAEEKEALKDQA